MPSSAVSPVQPTGDQASYLPANEAPLLTTQGTLRKTGWCREIVRAGHEGWNVEERLLQGVTAA